MDFNKENFVTAKYVNPERNVVEVSFESGDEVHQTYVEVDAKDPQFIELMKITNVDVIEENTLEYFEEQKNILIQFHKELIEKNIVEVEQESSYTEKTVEDLLRFVVQFDIPMNDKKTNEERLFNLKIAAFDLEEVENGPDELKEKIRMAAEPIELLNILYDFLHQETED